MGLVEACDAHQDGFNVESCFYLNLQRDVNIIFEQTLRGMAPSQPVGRTATPIERPSTHLDRCPVVIIEFCNLHQKKIDTAVHFRLKHGRFRCPFAEQNKEDWDHPSSPKYGEGLIPATKQNA